HALLHSFPTRRSSELQTGGQAAVAGENAGGCGVEVKVGRGGESESLLDAVQSRVDEQGKSQVGVGRGVGGAQLRPPELTHGGGEDRKSTRLNSSHVSI